MKKQFFFLCLALPVLVSAQENAAERYVEELRAKINSPSVEQIDLERGAEHFTAFYFNDELISLSTTENGEMANRITKEYFLRNDSLISFRVSQCLTSQEILDLDMYIAGNTDAKTGKTDWSKLPADCMEMNVYCPEKRFTRIISGKDVFEAPQEISSMCDAEQQAVKTMLETLDTGKTVGK